MNIPGGSVLLPRVDQVRSPGIVAEMATPDVGNDFTLETRFAEAHTVVNCATACLRAHLSRHLLTVANPNGSLRVPPVLLGKSLRTC